MVCIASFNILFFSYILIQFFSSYIRPSPTIRLYRIQNDNDEPRFKNFAILLREWRVATMRRILAKKTQRMKLDKEKICKWIDLFVSCEMKISENLQLQNALGAIIKQQKKVNETLEATQWTIENLSTIRFPEGSMPTKLSYFIAYKNSTNKLVLDELRQRIPFKIKSNLLASYASELVYEMPQNISSLLLSPTAISNSAIKNIIKRYGEPELFEPGMFIKCGENNKQDKIYNGQTAVFITYILSAPGVFSNLSLSKFIPFESNRRFSGKRLPINNINFTKYQLHQTNDDAIMGQILTMLVFDIATQTIMHIKPIKKYICDMCAQKSCPHHNSALSLPLTYHIFPWYINYSQTIHTIQGMTIANDNLFILSDYALCNHLQITINVILSRARDPAQIITDKKFIIECLRILFGVDFKVMDTFLKVNQILIPINN